MKTLQDLKDEMSRRGLSDYFEALAPFSRNSVKITLKEQDESALSIGASKLGGHPDLPPDAQWFRIESAGIPMSFVAQINFAEVAPFDTEHRLPERGILYFFYDCSCDGMPWGFDPEDSAGWRVYYYGGDLSLLSRKEAPADLTENENGVLFGSAGMSFESVAELPSTESDLVKGLVFPDDEAVRGRYWDWLDERGEEPCSKLLGHADSVQGGMELECEYVTHNISCGTPEGYRIAKSIGLDKNAARWSLLLQIDSCDGLGMMWGDLGRLYLWITDEDLAARNFENSWLILQCG